MKNPALGYGMHLTLDGYDCNPDKLANLDVIYGFLDHCPELITMNKIMPPYVFKYQADTPEDWGISGFVLIAESHISIHTFPEKNFVSVDIFSCKEFDSEFASGFFRAAFGMTKVDTTVLDRGTEFPKDMNGAARLVRAERRRIARPVVRAAARPA